MDDQDFMELAISMADFCKPRDAKWIPKVGAVIAQGPKILAQGFRQEDTHAEIDALNKVPDKSQLHGATVYTTLEPCTPEVRRNPEESCTKRLLDARVAKVVIGVLDPNQGVCGKGVLELQKHNIEVELFPHDLAQKIRTQNEAFIRAQQTLGLRFLEPDPNTELCFDTLPAKHTFKCECLTAPGSDIFVINRFKATYWPQRDKLRHICHRIYEFDSWFGATGFHTVYVVRANELGEALITYYDKIIQNNEHARRQLGIDMHKNRVKDYRIGYPGFDLTKLPRGLDAQGSIQVEIRRNPA
jgi:pyrimidine deaminase RibD-like protein